MFEQKPFRVEVVIDAPRDRVWAALTEPAEIRRWHGWDYKGLDDEIREIYVDNARHRGCEKIELTGGDGHAIELESRGDQTLVRAVLAGDQATADDRYDVIEEGWRAFLQQLRYYLAEHRGSERRTIHLAGTAVPPGISAALTADLPGRAWHAGRYQRGVATHRYGGALALLAAEVPLNSALAGPVSVTVGTYRLDDAGFAAAERELTRWWWALVPDGEVTT
nr:SRPBCC domain-containing protein [Micromonospora sp. DSM 115978]